MTRTAYDQAMLDDAERHVALADDHLCEACGTVVPCDGIACSHCPWPICEECRAEADGDDLLLATVDTVNRQLDEAIAATRELLNTERAINGR